jgi:hypothetical protein
VERFHFDFKVKTLAKSKIGTNVSEAAPKMSSSTQDEEMIDAQEQPINGHEETLHDGPVERIIRVVSSF